MTSNRHLFLRELRNKLRNDRRSLNEETQLDHALGLAKQLINSCVYKRSKKIALYLAADGEIDPEFIIQHAWQHHKKLYLPVLAPFSKRVYFAPYTPNTRMKENRFGIDEPDVQPKNWLKAHQLNCILMPLVGFDKKGNRLGMGGGFYDRSLHFMRFRKTQHQPILIGLAHQLQCINELPYNDHDIPLQLIATESKILQANR